MNSEKVSRKEVLPGFIAIITLAVIVYIAMELSAEKIADNQFIYSFGDLIGMNIEGGPMGRFLWFLTDLTEGCFTVSALGTIFMCIVVPFTAILERKKSPMAGTGVDGNGRNFSAMFIAAFVSILLSQIIYGRGEWFEKYGFIPTFSALLVSQTMITCYGKSLKKVITSIIIGAVVPFPICFMLMAYVTIPLGLPGFISVSLGLIITIPIVHKIVMLLPWMKEKENIPEEDYRYPMIRMNGKKREFLICEAPELVVTQGDIRQVQLAKGAILSGFLALLNKAGISMEELDKVMIAGQFGAHLPAESLTGTGILPKEVEDKIIYVGNSSKTGAYMTLLSEQVKEEMEGLAERMEYIELAETENYEKIFAESMRFV